MKATHAPTRTRQVLVRLTEDEYRELSDAAERLRCSNAEVMRSSWFFLKDADDRARRTA